MADKFEREIEEILAKLDGDGAVRSETPTRAPIPISSAKRKPPKKASPRKRAQGTSVVALPGLSPTTLLFTGAATMVAGLILSNVYGPLIWASFAGVVVFLGAFLWSFRKTSRSAGAAPPKGHYWRDRYITYTPSQPSAFDRVTRIFRRK